MDRCSGNIGACRVSRATKPLLFSVYALQDTRTGEFYYVGQTDDPAERLRDHRAKKNPQDRRHNSPCVVRNREILAAGVLLKMVVLKVFDTREAAEAYEIQAMDRLEQLGHTLVNVVREQRSSTTIEHRDLSTIPMYVAAPSPEERSV